MYHGLTTHLITFLPVASLGLLHQMKPGITPHQNKSFAPDRPQRQFGVNLNQVHLNIESALVIKVEPKVSLSGKLFIILEWDIDVVLGSLDIPRACNVCVLGLNANLPVLHWRVAFIYEPVLVRCSNRPHVS